MPLLYRNQTIDLFCKSLNWFLYDRELHHEGGKSMKLNIQFSYSVDLAFYFKLSFRSFP